MSAFRLRGALALLAVTAMSAVACSGSPASSESTGSDGDVTINVTERAGKVDPSGETVPVRKGQRVIVVVDSDVDDEFHVHSVPQHEFEVKAADNQRFSFSIDTPGTYEMESHHLEVVIVKLQVR